MFSNSLIDMSYQEALCPIEYQTKHINKVSADIKKVKADIEFCYGLLPKVSRTFAISINHLKGNLHLAVFTGYLFCRIADTIEDAWEVELSTKKRLFNLFDDILKSDNRLNESQLAEFEQLSLKLTGHDAHLKLCRNSDRVFRIFPHLPAPTQKIVIKWVRTMVKGMLCFVAKYPDGVKIQTIEEYHQYCFYVAGTVGHMLTGLWKLHGPPQSRKQKQILESFSSAFGEGLQTINILKDIANDAKVENNVYVPQQLLNAVGSSQGEITTEKKKEATYKAIGQMIDLANENLNKAFLYYCALPWRAFRIKLFCIAPLLFGLATLKKIASTKDMLEMGKVVKISRKKVKVYLILSYCLVFSKSLVFLLIRCLNSVSPRYK